MNNQDEETAKDLRTYILSVAPYEFAKQFPLPNLSTKEYQKLGRQFAIYAITWREASIEGVMDLIRPKYKPMAESIIAELCMAAI